MRRISNGLAPLGGCGFAMVLVTESAADWESAAASYSLSGS